MIMEMSCVDLVFIALKICGSKPIKEVIKAIVPDMKISVTSASSENVAFKLSDYKQNTLTALYF
jgi:hypothetical protein